ncbi:MAG: hypothetical protein A3C92_02760 [Candidatus Sungbacteria bacterium RIFCSPHIGHO2_02_FULL_53_17]|uniref:N-acetyltransferase domain-containing protein n=1 Tax=Candidatus Sungbacteria bacterium RIFCSPHIGHO2_02_FULL_53_17 TaxID=1802275 RepID=A0A1G2KX00_9BACT|nr:MAG: hypothetical protein A3C92_02760 [Candidatus Sungbacteria bacterium RIFCSPHIGHO2_02_FULL_53_17]
MERPKERDEEIREAEETALTRNERYARGQIGEDELRAHWENPDSPLFEHELVRQDREGREQRTAFRVRALTEEYKEPLLEAVKNSWTDVDFEDLKGTLERFFEQRALAHPGALNVEYYIATDTDDQPFAITGIYTCDIEGGAGFATRDHLDSAEHNIVAGLGWFAVGTDYQGTGMGSFLLDWTENVARGRGVKIMTIETDDFENEEVALKLYEKRGYVPGFDVRDYYGPGRDRFTYFLNITEASEMSSAQTEGMAHESITAENKDAVRTLAARLYAPARLEEFEAALNILLQHKEDDTMILKPESIVLRAPDGAVEGFSIFLNSLYENEVANYWYGSDPDASGAQSRLMEALRAITRERDREIVVTYREGEDPSLAEHGFQSSEGGIPFVFGKGDPTKFLFYTKKLES